MANPAASDVFPKPPVGAASASSSSPSGPPPAVLGPLLATAGITFAHDLPRLRPASELDGLRALQLEKQLDMEVRALRGLRSKFAADVSAKLTAALGSPADPEDVLAITLRMEKAEGAVATTCPALQGEYATAYWAGLQRVRATHATLKKEMQAAEAATVATTATVPTVEALMREVAALRGANTKLTTQLHAATAGPTLWYLRDMSMMEQPLDREWSVLITATHIKLLKNGVELDNLKKYKVTEYGLATYIPFSLEGAYAVSYAGSSWRMGFAEPITIKSSGSYEPWQRIDVPCGPSDYLDVAYNVFMECGGARCVVFTKVSAGWVMWVRIQREINTHGGSWYHVESELDQATAAIRGLKASGPGAPASAITPAQREVYNARNAAVEAIQQLHRLVGIVPTH